MPLDPFSEHVEQDLDEEEVEQLKKTFSQPLTYRQEEVLRALNKSYNRVPCTSASVFFVNISILSWD